MVSSLTVTNTLSIDPGPFKRRAFVLPKFGYLGDPTSPFYHSLLPQKGSFNLR